VDALASYNKLLNLLPKSAVAYYKVALIQAASKDFEGAKASLNKALQLKPDYLEAQAALASQEVQAGRYVEALKIAQGIQRQSPKSPAGFVFEGDVLMRQSKYAEAARNYEKAFGMGKNGVLAIKMHQAQSLAGDVKKADNGLLLWLKEQPNDLEASVYLAQVRANAGRNKEAIALYEAILQKTPDTLLVLNNLAWLYLSEKDPRALATAEHAFKLGPDAPVIGDTLGWMLLEQGKTARGLEILQKAAAAEPKNPEINYHYAVALARSGDKAKARKLLESALASGQRFSQIEQAKALLKQL
jgi:putative PEP-CTERM system TPR-repeat lipoprotein